MHDFFIISSFQKTKYLFPILKPMLSISHNYFFLPFLIFYHNHVKYNLIIALDSHLVFHVYYAHFVPWAGCFVLIFYLHKPVTCLFSLHPWLTSLVNAETETHCWSSGRHFPPTSRLWYICGTVPGSSNKTTGHTRHHSALHHGVLQRVAKSPRNDRILGIGDPFWPLYGGDIQSNHPAHQCYNG